MKTYNLKDIKSIDINAKRWFRQNTYHTVNIVLNYGLKDELELNTPIEYGYDRQYETTAINAINEILGDDKIDSFYQLRELNILVQSSHIDVKRKKDL